MDQEKKKCFLCKKKLNIMSQMKCKCGKFYCSIHRHLEIHNCPSIEIEKYDTNNKGLGGGKFMKIQQI